MPIYILAIARNRCSAPTDEQIANDLVHCKSNFRVSTASTVTHETRHVLGDDRYIIHAVRSPAALADNMDNNCL